MFILFLFLIRECWKHQALIFFSLRNAKYTVLVQSRIQLASCSERLAVSTLLRLQKYMHIIILLYFNLTN